MPTEEIKHFDDVVDDIMHCLAECTEVQQAVVAHALRVRSYGEQSVLDKIGDLISSADFPASKLADLASRLMESNYKYQGDSLFSVLHVDGPRFQELAATGDLDVATDRFLEIAHSQGGPSANMTVLQAREIVSALIPGRPKS